MTIRFIGCSIKDNGVGVSVPKDADVHFEGTDLSSNGIGLEIRDLPSLLARIGLPPDTPRQDLRRLLDALHRAPAGDLQVAAEMTRRSRLAKWMAKRALDLSAFAANLTTIAQGEGFSEAMELLK